MALTRRSFLEPALDRIWREIDSFNPLIACLPRGAWREYKPFENSAWVVDLNFRGTLSSSDLGVYLTKYASRIRKFSPNVSLEEKIFSLVFFQALQLITNYRPGSLAPCVTELGWVPIRQAQYLENSHLKHLGPFVYLFMGANVTSFTAFDYSDTAHLPSLAFVTEQLQNLTTLNATALYRPRSADSIAKSCWDQLEVINVDLSRRCNGGSFFKSIVQKTLPKLRTLLVLDNSSRAALNLQPEYTNPFPRVQKIVLTALQPSYGASLLRIINRLDAIKILSFRVRRSQTGDEGPELLVSSIFDRCSPATLEAIQLHETTPSANTSSLRRLDAPIDELLDITPLYKFTRLKMLDIQLDCAVRVTQRDITNFTAVWPGLQILNLCPSFHNVDSLPSINHTHLVQILDVGDLDMGAGRNTATFVSFVLENRPSALRQGLSNLYDPTSRDWRSCIPPSSDLSGQI
ncbi:hypothetical protein FA13DRAFT_1803152 [Coprinellus micaceus]|uniref:F-box domain-containing protein n=1 Tax=Coprinellus micaceus TaxID=71717 RepID=A0A4Y7SAP9_COPMI|nr:hypothetical protein FA13DRAFT_1803152 [Coprinellus micaceus]